MDNVFVAVESDAINDVDVRGAAINDSSDLSTEITDFSEIPITTISMEIYLNSKINVDLFFLLFPITKYEVPRKNKKTKCKLSEISGLPKGAIISANCRKEKRGIIRNTKKSFQNCIELYLSIYDKMIYCKLCPETIQLCGAKSIEQGLEAATLLINHCHNIHKYMNKIHSSIPLQIQPVESPIKPAVPKVEPVVSQESKVDYCRLAQDFIVKNQSTVLQRIPDSNPARFRKIFRYSAPLVPEYPTETTESDEDLEIVHYLISLSTDYDIVNNYVAKLDWIKQNSLSLINEQLHIVGHEIDMINYNYNLGFLVNKSNLAELINNYEGYNCNYYNEAQAFVKIEKPHKAKINSKKAVPHITILVYRTGSVTQSGPGIEINKETYYEFMNIISEIKELITL